jgi:hypothetical protein
LATQGPNSIPPPPNRSGNNTSKMSAPINTKNAFNTALDDFRPDMRGPDINELLSGLKTKTIDIQHSNNNSTISLSDLKELDGDQLPKKSKRRKSDKNVINLN